MILGEISFFVACAPANSSPGALQLRRDATAIKQPRTDSAALAERLNYCASVKSFTDAFFREPRRKVTGRNLHNNFLCMSQRALAESIWTIRFVAMVWSKVGLYQTPTIGGVPNGLKKLMIEA